MPRFDHIPLLRIFVLYAGGLAFAEYFCKFVDFPVHTILQVLLILAVLSFLSLKLEFSRWFSVFAALFLFTSGIFLHQNFDERNSNTHFTKFYNKESDYLKVKILNAVKSSNGAKLKCQVIECIRKDTSFFVNGNLLVFSDSVPVTKQYQYGDILIFKSKITPIPGENNPHAFDPASYYHFFNIHYQCFINGGRFYHQANDREFIVKRAFELLNRNIQKTLLSIIPDKANANLAISIILGDRQELDKEILTSFSITGLTHMLSVSGMHVGIVALILNWLFSAIKSNGVFYKLLKLVLQIAGIWFYSFLTGNEPAILRAAFMISLVLIGFNMKKYISSLNILFGSALILLFFNPFQMFQLSFMFSYAAMLGIFIFYKPIYDLVNAESFVITRYIWQITSLSVSSQVFLYPLLIYYFHNGPTLFILTSFIATPMSFAAIFLGFFGVFADLIFHGLASLTGRLLSLSFDISLYLIDFFASISANTGDYFYIGNADLLLIYMIIASLSLYFFSKNKLSFTFIFVLAILLITNQFFRIKYAKSTDEMVIFHSKKNVVADFYIDGNCYNFSKNKLSDQEYVFTNRNYRLYRSVNNTVDLPDSILTEYFRWKSNILTTKEKTIVFLKNKNDLIPFAESKIDVLVLSENISYDLRPVMDNFEIAQIVLSNNIDYKQRNYIKRYLANSEIPIWDVNEKGAFMYKLN
ncbi:MAG: ComEC family competence protein [Saprospiraceae bacterium]|nr:ComEC family competence protein [Saprospiraceae bacterium]